MKILLADKQDITCRTDIRDRENGRIGNQVCGRQDRADACLAGKRRYGGDTRLHAFRYQ